MMNDDANGLEQMTFTHAVLESETHSVLQWHTNISQKLQKRSRYDWQISNNHNWSEPKESYFQLQLLK